MGHEKVVTGPLTGSNQALDEIAGRALVGRDLPLARVYELTVRGIVKRYEELADVRA